MTNYDHRRIEQKWQHLWEEKELFQVEADPSKPKYYILDMFPYPSGAGLHVGHVTGYTATDILSRYMRSKGYNVLHPMGWDSFGLPAEQYAIRTGTHPAITTEQNINTYRRQLKSLGFSYDWSREVATSDPSYYKWTQWIFTKLYEKGLAYEAEASVNYCPALGTVLANEEVENGHAKEGGYPVERRPLRQWILKITAYADQLIEDLKLVDWPESLKRLQINWIGRSEGVKIHFKEEKTGETITVFTTRHDTSFGVTFLVLSPEHPLVEKITTPEHKKHVHAYQKEVASKNDMQRTDLAKEKTGVWTGAYAINPFNRQRVPIWIADYVLMTYGTGAVMGVPAHDERDFEFVKKYNLDILPVIEPQDPESKTALLDEKICYGDTVQTDQDRIFNSGFLDGLTIEQAKKKAADWLVENQAGEKTVNYKLRDWLFSRQRYWGEPFPILHFEDGTKRILDLDELPLCPPELKDYKPSGIGESPLAKVKAWVEITDPKTGKKARRETNTMPQWAGSCWYYLRFADPDNRTAPIDPEREKYWLPVDLYVGGAEHAVLHLLYARFWHKVLYDIGVVSTKEPFQKLFNQGMILAFSYRDSSGKYYRPDEVIKRDGQWFAGDKPVSQQVEKMSKSKFNVVNPDEVIDIYGADSMRLYEMFIGPLDVAKPWQMSGVAGVSRFLHRVWRIVADDGDGLNEQVCEIEPSAEVTHLMHKTIRSVGEDIEAMRFNTAISKLMEMSNALTALDRTPRSVVEVFVLLLAPFAPHICEELWGLLGHETSLAYESWPISDSALADDERREYVVQINGKLRHKVFAASGLSAADLVLMVRADPRVASLLDGKQIVKEVVVPNRLINFVVKN